MKNKILEVRIRYGAYEGRTQLTEKLISNGRISDWVFKILFNNIKNIIKECIQNQEKLEAIKQED